MAVLELLEFSEYKDAYLSQHRSNTDAQTHAHKHSYPCCSFSTSSQVQQPYLNAVISSFGKQQEGGQHLTAQVLFKCCLSEESGQWERQNEGRAETKQSSSCVSLKEICFLFIFRNCSSASDSFIFKSLCGFTSSKTF